MRTKRVATRWAAIVKIVDVKMNVMSILMTLIVSQQWRDIMARTSILWQLDVHTRFMLPIITEFWIFNFLIGTTSQLAWETHRLQSRHTVWRKGVESKACLILDQVEDGKWSQESVVSQGLRKEETCKDDKDCKGGSQFQIQVHR